MKASSTVQWDDKKHSKRLRSFRTSEGLSQKQLAEALEVSQVTVSNWETGSTSPRKGMIAKLVSKFGPELIDLDSLSEASLPSSSLAQWLYAQRVGAGLTRSELATKAKITSQTVYNIERGRVTSPHPPTIEGLRSALDQRIPDFSGQIGGGRDAVDLGDFLEFDPHDLQNLPDVAGIYVFYDISDRPIYVGQSGNIAERIASRLRKNAGNHTPGGVDGFGDA